MGESGAADFQDDGSEGEGVAAGDVAAGGVAVAAAALAAGWGEVSAAASGRGLCGGFLRGRGEDDRRGGWGGA